MCKDGSMQIHAHIYIHTNIPTKVSQKKKKKTQLLSYFIMYCHTTGCQPARAIVSLKCYMLYCSVLLFFHLGNRENETIGGDT